MKPINATSALSPSDAAHLVKTQYYFTQTVEYFQQSDPIFEARDGKFTFRDEGKIYAKQVMEKNPEQVATGGLNAKVWAVTRASFAQDQVGLQF